MKRNLTEEYNRYNKMEDGWVIRTQKSLMELYDDLLLSMTYNCINQCIASSNSKFINYPEGGEVVKNPNLL